MAQGQITAHVHVAWWLKPWLHCLALTCAVMQTEPDWNKVMRMIDRALSVRFS